MKHIPLPNGMVCTVSDEDYEAVKDRKWYAHPNGHHYYVVRDRLKSEGPGAKAIFLHRVILNAPKHLHVDHVDGNGLNNCRENIRLCTCSQNQMNRGRQRNNTSGAKGVFASGTKALPWFAQLRFQNRQYYLGKFRTVAEASAAYEAKAKELFGEFYKEQVPTP
jgi:hypothetical protein